MTTFSIPTLTTPRLTLRPYQRADFDAYAALMASDRARFMGGPYSVSAAWNWFANDTVTWQFHGFGTLAVVHAGDLAGFVGLVYPPTFPEPEIGWGLFDGFVGQGIATEAARAILAHTFATTDLTTLVSYIDKGNAASVRVAERIGGVLDPAAPTPFDEDDLVYRHFPQGAAA